LEAELSEHPDRDFVEHLIGGLRHGFDTGVKGRPVASFECDNLRSAKADPEFVAVALAAEVENGYMIGPFDTSPFPVYRVSPIGVAEGKYSGKKRLIIDLSAPHDNSDHASINNLIDKDDFSLSYVTVDDAIDIIKQLGHNSMMTKTDMVDAFKVMPIRTDLWSLYGVKWDSKYYFSSKLSFGSRSSPKIFDFLSQAICWIMQHNYDLHHVLHLLDDFLGLNSPDDVAERTMAVMKMVFKKLNIAISERKTMGPSPVMEFLGITLDSIRMEARLPRNKVERMKQLLDHCMTRKTCTKQELLSLLGHLHYASRVMLPGRSFVSYLIWLSTTVSNLFDHVYLTDECRADMYMWSEFLESWNGVSLFLEDNITDSADFHLFTDASGMGYGGVFRNKWFQGTWPQGFDTHTNTAANMAKLELFPVVVAAVLWGSEWGRKKILFHCDNMATVFILKKGRSKDRSIMRLVRKHTFCAAKYSFSVHSAHLRGKIIRNLTLSLDFNRSVLTTGALHGRGTVPGVPVDGLAELLDDRVDRLWSTYIQPATRASYTTGLNCLRRFGS
jgi:hypothetical protein